MSTNRFGVRTLAVLAVAGIAVLGTPAIASAHVSAQPAEFTQGGRATFAFRVPNEKEAGTVKVEVTLPQEYPLTTVRTKPLPGWKAEVVKGKLDKPVTTGGKEVTEAFKTITWTAEPGVKIAVNQYEDFSVALGTLPEGTDKLLLPVKQTYENGEVADWNQPAGADGKEPERPAPTLILAAKQAGGEDHHGGATNAANGTDTNMASMGGSDQTARYLGGAGLAVGALGLGFGIGAILRSRRKA